MTIHSKRFFLTTIFQRGPLSSEKPVRVAAPLGGDIRTAGMSATRLSGPSRSRTPVSCFSRLAKALSRVFSANARPDAAAEPMAPSAMGKPGTVSASPCAATEATAALDRVGAVNLFAESPEPQAIFRLPAIVPESLSTSPLSSKQIARLTNEIRQVLYSRDGTGAFYVLEKLLAIGYANRQQIDWSSILAQYDISVTSHGASATNHDVLAMLLPAVPYMAAGTLHVPRDLLNLLPPAQSSRQYDWMNSKSLSGIANQIARIQLHEVHHLLHESKPISVSMATIASLLGNSALSADKGEPGFLPGFGEIDVSRIADVPDFNLQVLGRAINVALVGHDVNTLENISKLLHQLPPERLKGQNWQQLLLHPMLRAEGMVKAGRLTSKNYWQLLGREDREAMTYALRPERYDLDERIAQGYAVIGQLEAMPYLSHAKELIDAENEMLSACMLEIASNRKQLMAALQPLLDMIPAELLVSPSTRRTLESLTLASAWKVNVPAGRF
jgi:hypothetical protein